MENDNRLVISTSDPAPTPAPESIPPEPKNSSSQSAPAAAKQDNYSILGVTPLATADEIKRVYRRESIKRHPDRNPNNPNAGEDFAALNAAYEALLRIEERTQGNEGAMYIRKVIPKFLADKSGGSEVEKEFADAARDRVDFELSVDEESQSTQEKRAQVYSRYIEARNKALAQGINYVQNIDDNVAGAIRVNSQMLQQKRDQEAREKRAAMEADLAAIYVKGNKGAEYITGDAYTYAKGENVTPEEKELIEAARRVVNFDLARQNPNFFVATRIPSPQVADYKSQALWQRYQSAIAKAKQASNANREFISNIEMAVNQAHATQQHNIELDKLATQYPMANYLRNTVPEFSRRYSGSGSYKLSDQETQLAEAASELVGFRLEHAQSFISGQITPELAEREKRLRENFDLAIEEVKKLPPKSDPQDPRISSQEIESAMEEFYNEQQEAARKQQEANIIREEQIWQQDKKTFDTEWRLASPNAKNNPSAIYIRTFAENVSTNPKFTEPAKKLTSAAAALVNFRLAKSALAQQGVGATYLSRRQQDLEKKFRGAILISRSQRESIDADIIDKIEKQVDAAIKGVEAKEERDYDAKGAARFFVTNPHARYINVDLPNWMDRQQKGFVPEGVPELIQAAQELVNFRLVRHPNTMNQREEDLRSKFSAALENAPLEWRKAVGEAVVMSYITQHDLNLRRDESLVAADAIANNRAARQVKRFSAAATKSKKSSAAEKRYAQVAEALVNFELSKEKMGYVAGTLLSEENRRAFLEKELADAKEALEKEPKGKKIIKRGCRNLN